jgi:Fe-S oxidoreductase
MKKEKTKNRKKQIKKNLTPKKRFEISMNGQAGKNKESVPTKVFLRGKVSEYSQRCIECNRCMDVCPVTKDTFSIHDLNVASQDGQSVPLKIQEFAFRCMQCGQCVPVCPKDIRRDHMVRYIKYKIRNKTPWGYKRYLLIKGPNQTGMRRIIQQLFIRSKKLTNKDLACFMETTPEKKVDVLFYPGCYIYSAKTVRQTLRLLKHVGSRYNVLGGVTACCGAPHLLQGEFDQADDCLELLYQKIKAGDPRIILTACAECYEAVEQIRKMYQMDVEVLSVAQYLLRYQDKFLVKKIRGKITVHDSCRFRPQSPQGVAAHDAVSRFGELAKPPMDQPSSCCYKWNHGSDPNNALRLVNYLTAVKNHAPTLVCNCLTCFEELKKTSTDVEIIDVLQLFEEALQASETREEES